MLYRLAPAENACFEEVCVSSFMTQRELEGRGLVAVHRTAQVSRHATFYGPERIQINAHSRIDDFCVLSAGDGGIMIGQHVHVSVMVSMQGAAAIHLDDFATISSRVAIYSSSDDYSGECMTNPTIPDHLRRVDNRPVSIGRHAIVGAGAVILPGVVVGEGSGIGALSLVRVHCDPFTMYAGVPAVEIGKRARDTVRMEQLIATDDSAGG